MPFFYWFDPTYILVIIGLILSLAASSKVKSTYAKYSKVRNMSGITGAEAARKILNSAGIYDVQIRHVSGELTDHYDPRSKTLNLSDVVYGAPSVAAVGVAAHECGHAIQDAKNYAPLKIRGALVPVANFGSSLAMPLILLGIIFGVNSQWGVLINVGIILFSLAVLFQLITLPVEFNASKRAVELVSSTGILYGEEVEGTKKVLSAAALTYVAAAAASLLSLLRLILLFGGQNRD